MNRRDIERILPLTCVCILILLMHVPAFACWTPLKWQKKPVEWNRDVDANGLDDGLDELVAAEADALLFEDGFESGDLAAWRGLGKSPSAGSTVPIVVNLTRCPEDDDLDWIRTYGDVVKVGRYVNFVAMENVALSDLDTLVQNPLVAFVEQMHGFGSSLDVGGAAIKVRSSTTYPNNLEDLAPTVDGTGTTVAIIDSGVDDQDGSGTTHDSFPVGKFVGGYVVGSGLGNPNDSHGHGTHVAGTAVGTGGGSGGVLRGMAPGASLVDCQTTLMCGPPSWLDVIECFEQIWYNDAAWQVDVVNVSLKQCTVGGATITTDGTDAVSQMANFLVAQDITVVAAASNEGPFNVGLTSPCAADNAICVAAMDDQNTISRSDDSVASFSSRGPRADDGDLDVTDERKPEISAPGVGIASAMHDTSSLYINDSGTSMASPHVAGAAALIHQISPGINPGSIKNLLIQTAEDWGAVGWDADSGNGYIDVWAATSTAGAADPAYPNHGSYPRSWLCTDITTATSPVVGVPNTVTVSITNTSAVAANHVEITFGAYIYSTGAPAFFSIGSKVVNVAAGATMSISHPWIPQASPTGNSHACLLSTIHYGFDTDFGNNTCRRNISIDQTRSPVHFTFEVQNLLKEDATIELEPVPQLEFPLPLPGTGTYVVLPGERLFAFDRWTPTLEETRLVMAATDCPRPLRLTLSVDPDATPVDGGIYSLPAIATPEGGEPVELGGITAYGHTPCPESWRGDGDGDAVCDIFDNCPEMNNAEQLDADGDGIGDICDQEPRGPSGEPCSIQDVDHPYYSTFACLIAARTIDLPMIIEQERSVSSLRTAIPSDPTRGAGEDSLTVLQGVLDAGLARIQNDFCEMDPETGLARIEATRYRLDVFSSLTEISDNGATRFASRLAECAAMAE